MGKTIIEFLYEKDMVKVLNWRSEGCLFEARLVSSVLCHFIRQKFDKSTLTFFIQV